MAKITISRNLSFSGFSNSYKIFINDKARALVRNNASRTLELKPGFYRLRVGLGRFNTRSNQLIFNLEEDSHLFFTAKSSVWLFYGLLLAFAGLNMLRIFILDGSILMCILGIITVIVGFTISSLYAVKLERVDS